MLPTAALDGLRELGEVGKSPFLVAKPAHLRHEAEGVDWEYLNQCRRYATPIANKQQLGVQLEASLHPTIRVAHSRDEPGISDTLSARPLQDDPDFYVLGRYVERNPLRANWFPRLSFGPTGRFVDGINRPNLYQSYFGCSQALSDNDVLDNIARNVDKSEIASLKFS